jgi:hypothetical protein
MEGKLQQGAAGTGVRLGSSGCNGDETDERGLYTLHATGCDADRPHIRYQKYQLT